MKRTSRRVIRNTVALLMTIFFLLALVVPKGTPFGAIQSKQSHPERLSRLKLKVKSLSTGHLTVLLPTSPRSCFRLPPRLPTRVGAAGKKARG